ncbi:hypothetical protein R3P38DRAFT_2778280 [Favolaschia claudopus]|uniref:Uncharacterized protein n=1 Tax=Favolaschia claudopus TaxID=2862362 RepID=A0AAW0BIK3_9AGAR
MYATSRPPVTTYERKSSGNSPMSVADRVNRAEREKFSRSEVGLGAITSRFQDRFGAAVWGIQAQKIRNYPQMFVTNRVVTGGLHEIQRRIRSESVKRKDVIGRRNFKGRVIMMNVAVASSRRILFGGGAS